MGEGEGQRDRQPEGEDLSNLKPGQTMGGSGRGARRTGGWGRVGLGANRIDRQGNKGPSYSPGHRKHVA